jgi:hypothetical protein
VKRLTPLFLLGIALALAAAPLSFAASGRSEKAKEKSPAVPVAAALSTITGIAISPLLGTGAYGAYLWVVAEDDAARAALPWYAQMPFWLPALLIAGVCAAKDVAGTAVPPGLKKPLDILEVVENKISGLVAAGFVIPVTIGELTKLWVETTSSTGPSPLATDGLAMIQLGAMDFSWGLMVLMIPLALALFAVVWMASHAINVLILLSPWGAIDAALKAARTGLLGLLALSAIINPWLGAALSLVVIVVAWLVVGWAFRLTVFGSVFCWDFLTNRSGRFSPRENDNAMFAGPNLPGVHVRTLGRLVQRTEGGLEFFYRPWPWLPERRAKVPVARAQLAAGRGLFFSTILTEEGGTLFLLPPRYRGHEDVLARAYLMGGGVREAGLRRAWNVMRELFGGVAAKTQLV